ncbi:hypothetical protein MKX03_021926, partial [Papaver bracteatum]
YGCSITGAGLLHYNMTCDTTYNPPKPLIRAIEVVSISETEVCVKNLPVTKCYQYKTSELTLDEGIGWMDFRKTPFAVSYSKNKYFGLGCYTIAMNLVPFLNFSIPYVTTCETTANIMDGSCSGSGCCQTILPKN